LGTTALTNAGAIRWTGTDFEGYKSSSWVSLTASDIACINVKDYGAVGDGATDDATAYQNALNAAATGEKCVVIPEGTYIIGTTLTIDDDVTFRGIGWGSILKAKSTLPGAILTNKNHHPGQNQYVTISDLYLDGNKTARATGYCLHFNNLQWSRITNVKIENSPSYGIYLDGSSAFCDEIAFTNCLFRYNENSGIYFYVSSANMMVNCSFFSNNMVTGYGAVSINGGSQNVINGCSIMSNHLHGVFLSNSYSNIVKGCTTINNKHHGIYLGTNANDNVVTNNTCDGNSSGASGVYSGIVLEGAALRNVVNGNRSYNGLYTSNTQKHGIIETGAADYNAIIGNVLTGNLSDDLVVVGPHTKAYHNVDVADKCRNTVPG
jgi:parallel beta-helix repeat protein